MIVRKVCNAGELLWDSLDGRERMIVAYAAAWVLFAVGLTWRRRQLERTRRQLVADVLDELHGAARG